MGHAVGFLQVYLQGIWRCVGLESGTVFPEVDLSDGEWVDYDEKVCITALPYALSVLI